MQATLCQVLRDRLASVLLGDDVVQLKRKRIELRWDAAMVTPVESKSANLIQQGSIHSSPDVGPRIAFNDRRAFDCRMANVWPRRM